MLFADIASEFTRLRQSHRAGGLVNSWTYSAFDELVDQHGLGENQGQQGLLHSCQRRSAAPA